VERPRERLQILAQGGIAPRYRANGQPDCPAVESGDAVSQTGRDITRELGRGLDALKREVDRLGDRFK
jgi:hypothetical protein